MSTPQGLTIREYVNGYTYEDIGDGDVNYRETDTIDHTFDDIDELLTWCVDNISGEGSQGPIGTLAAADTGRYWIARHDTEFRHGASMPNGLGGDWFTDRSWHFDQLDVVTLTRVLLAIEGDVYGLVPYWS